MLVATATLCCLSLSGWLYLAFFRGAFWQLTMDDAPEAFEPSVWPSLDVIVPARNEADMLPQTLPSLLAQDYPGTWRILVVDDHSDDNTSKVALQTAGDSKGTTVVVLRAPDLQPGWRGKIAAMQAGVAQSTADYVLFTDADIAHPSDNLRKLVAHAAHKKIDLTSRMVKLHCSNLAERLLIPAFVFFFGLLYPFRHANALDRQEAAAAGGVMLVRRRALNAIGGLAAIKSALIDDCALARAIKRHGGADQTQGRIELTLTRDTKSLRVYSEVGEIYKMVARTAFTQLRHSATLLAATTLGMLLLFLIPVVFAFFGGAFVKEAAIAAWVVMFMVYLPTVRFYDLPVIWAFALPLAALVYIVATIDSGRLYWQGKGGEWKGRTQA
ncbi:MAG: glycosyltransferase [Pseudomonadota bacterium]|nr:glycosyltransferase [Pseudomonadota bacterium]